MENNNGLPLGFRFEPTGSQLLTHYLLNKVRGLPLSCDYAVIDCDLYDGKDRWREMFDGWDVQSMYFFTKLKKRSGSGRRIQRCTGGSGTWKETQTEKNIYSDSKRQILGTKKSFKFVPNNKGGGSGSNNNNLFNNGRWLMDEYRLHSCFLDDTMDEYVISHIKHDKDMKYSKSCYDDEGVNPTAINNIIVYPLNPEPLNSSGDWETGEELEAFICSKVDEPAAEEEKEDNSAQALTTFIHPSINQQDHQDSVNKYDQSAAAPYNYYAPINMDGKGIQHSISSDQAALAFHDINNGLPPRIVANLEKFVARCIPNSQHSI